MKSVKNLFLLLLLLTLLTTEVKCMDYLGNSKTYILKKFVDFARDNKSDGYVVKIDSVSSEESFKLNSYNVNIPTFTLSFIVTQNSELKYSADYYFFNQSDCCDSIEIKLYCQACYRFMTRSFRRSVLLWEKINRDIYITEKNKTISTNNGVELWTKGIIKTFRFKKGPQLEIFKIYKLTMASDLWKKLKRSKTLAKTDGTINGLVMISSLLLHPAEL